MKKFFSAIAFTVVCAIAFTACNKEIDTYVQENQDGLVTISITADNPEVDASTRTELVGTTPYWSIGDAIGVAWANESSYGSASFGSGLTEKALTATFTGEVANANLGKTAYAFYPYTTNNITNAGIAPIDIPETQYPSSSSFDSKADLMVGLRSFELSETVTEMAFRRLGAVVKVIIVDNTTGAVLTNQHPVDVKLTVAENIIGRAKVDLANMSLNGFSSGQKKYVQAVYKSDKYAINGTNATYFVVYPQVLEANSGITLEGTTEGYKFEKVITTHPEINLKAGCITTLKIKVDAATVDASGAELPFHEDFAAITDGNNTSTSGSSSAASTSDLTQFKTVSTAYKAGGAVRLGKGGTLETKELDLSSDFSVIVKIKGWSASENTLTATIGESTFDFVATTAMSDDFVEFSHTFSAASKKSTVVFTTDASTRVFIDDIKIVSGAYTPKPVISVPVAPAAAAASDTSIEFGFEISNPTEGSELTVEESTDWITNAAVDQTNKTVTLTITTATEARNADITLKYPGADDYVLNVSQEAPGATPYALLSSAPDNWTKGWLIIVGGDAKALTGLGESEWGQGTAVTVSSGKIAKAAGDLVACTVEAGSASGKFAIKLPSGKYIGSVTGNSFAVSDNPADLEISVASNGDISIDVNPSTKRYIKYLSSNADNKAFRCYTSSTGELPKGYWLADTEPSLSATDITLSSALQAVENSTITWDNFASDPTVTISSTTLPSFVDEAEVSSDGKTLTVAIKDNYTLSENTGEIELTATLGTITKTAVVHITQPASVFEASSTNDMTFAWDDNTNNVVKSTTITSTFALSSTNVAVNGTDAARFAASLTRVGTSDTYTLIVQVNQDNESGSDYSAIVTVSRNGLSIPINLTQSDHTNPSYNPYSTGFEASEGFTARTNYQSTVTDGEPGKTWVTYYGTPSTSSKISGDQSLALRLYNNNNNYAYSEMQFDVPGATGVSFKAKAGSSSNAAIKLTIKQSVDGGQTWSTVSGWNAQSLSGSAKTYSFSVSGTPNQFRIRFEIDSSSTKPSSGNVQLTIDDVEISVD